MGMFCTLTFLALLMPSLLCAGELLREDDPRTSATPDRSAATSTSTPPPKSPPSGNAIATATSGAKTPTERSGKKRPGPTHSPRDPGKSMASIDANLRESPKTPSCSSNSTEMERLKPIRFDAPPGSPMSTPPHQHFPPTFERLSLEAPLPSPPTCNKRDLN